MTLFVTFLLIYGLSFYATAEVNPITGAFMLKHTDLLTKEQLFPFKISRSYNHKISSVGVFGNKWCSNLDERISFTDNGIIIKKCEKESWLLYTKNKDKVYVNAISTEFIKPIEDNKGFVRFTNDKIIIYNDRGFIVSSSSKLSPEKPHTIYYYNNEDNLSKVVHEKLIYEFIFDKEKKRITNIKLPNKNALTFNYDANNNLIYAQDAWGDELQYVYDSSNRLTRVTYSDDNFADISYNKENMVTSVAKSIGCESTISYKVDIKSSSLKSDFVDTCNNSDSAFDTTRSPLFFKNRTSISKQQRSPASYNINSLEIKPKWKQIRSKDSIWQYVENSNGNIIQVRETDLATKQINKMDAVYQDQKLVKLLLNNKGLINFIYKGNKLVSMKGIAQSKEADETFSFFSNFLKIKAGVGQNEK